MTILDKNTYFGRDTVMSGGILRFPDTLPLIPTLNSGGNVGSNVGATPHMMAEVRIDVAVLSGGATTVTFKLVSGEGDALANPVVHSVSDAFNKGTLLAGFSFQLALPPIAPAYKDTLGIIWVVGGNAITTGTASGYLTRARPDVRQYQAAGKFFP